jgi:hypothetical protein
MQLLFAFPGARDLGAASLWQQLHWAWSACLLLLESWCRIETLNHAGYKWTLVKEGEQPRSSWDSAPPQPPPQPDNDPWARESSGNSTVQVLGLLWRPGVQMPLPACANNGGSRRGGTEMHRVAGWILVRLAIGLAAAWKPQVGVCCPQVTSLQKSMRHRDDQLQSLRAELARLEATRDRCQPREQ